MDRKPLLGAQDADQRSRYEAYPYHNPNPASTQRLYPPPTAPPYPGAVVNYDHRYVGPGASPPLQLVAGIPYVPPMADDCQRVYIPPDWTYGLCDFHTDVPLCLLTWLFPCVTFGRNAAAIDDGVTSCTTAAAVWCLLQSFCGLACLYSWGFRTKLRRKYNLPEEPMPDILVHCCCMHCALCQEYKELRYRGIDPEGGWGPTAVYGAPTAAPGQQAMGASPYGFNARGV
ncbi:hypothetical protein CBR_g23455 [Chara braunii]|uniref:Uncharacterized protein n=1 Tax=Chara braunii TaxID=69332 RepID=A0A388L492_CHABU|nr:hypothetical protein CBR_g23455 [Chara braunii]|eukprot:GBG77129.1 hypothetical protein CBR_g23455 [Chara braunii]